MANHLRRILRLWLQRAFRLLFPLLRRLYYDVINQSVFDDLYTHEMMLADRPRVDAYWEAIERHVQEGDVVIDLGTGTGILAFFAAARRPAKVYAIDHAGILDVARKVGDANGVSCVEFLKVNSRKLQLPEKADVIIHEQMGQALFDEQMVENVADLRDRLLKPGGKILPAEFELYIDPVQMKDGYAVPFAWEQVIHGVDFSKLQEQQPAVAPDYGFKLLAQHEFDHFLCPSEPALRFSLDTVEGGDLVQTFRLRRTVRTPGRVDGLCVHFVARFDEEISISTSPFAPRTSWKVPLLRVESRRYEVGEVVDITVDADDLTSLRSWRWTVARTGDDM